MTRIQNRDFTPAVLYLDLAVGASETTLGVDLLGSGSKGVVLTVGAFLDDTMDLVASLQDSADGASWANLAGTSLTFGAGEAGGTLKSKSFLVRAARVRPHVRVRLVGTGNPAASVHAVGYDRPEQRTSSGFDLELVDS